MTAPEALAVKFCEKHNGKPMADEALSGHYEADGSNHGRPVYRRRGGGPDVVVYYWEEAIKVESGSGDQGWWFGRAVGGASAWAWHPSAGAGPPERGWHFVEFVGRSGSVEDIELVVARASARPVRPSLQLTASRRSPPRSRSRSHRRGRAPAAALWERAPRSPRSPRGALSSGSPSPARRTGSPTRRVRLEMVATRGCGEEQRRGVVLQRVTALAPAPIKQWQAARSWQRGNAHDDQWGAPGQAVALRIVSHSDWRGQWRRQEIAAFDRSGKPRTERVELAGMELEDGGLRLWCAREGAQRLRRLAREPLACIDVSDNGISDDGVRVLIDFLRERGQIAQRLKLFKNKLQDPLALCELIEDPHLGCGTDDGLSELHLSSNWLGIGAIDRLLASLGRRVKACGGFRVPVWLRVEHNGLSIGEVEELVQRQQRTGLHVCLEGGVAKSGCSIGSCRLGADVHLHARGGNATSSKWWF